jgi:serine/threonine-protein kinase RsbW
MPQTPTRPARPTTPLRLWPATPHSVHTARHALLAELRAWGLGELADAGGLVLSELFTNAVQHGTRAPGRQVGTRFLRADDRTLRLEVHDGGRELLKRRVPRGAGGGGLWDERGRGLGLVEAVTGGRWGIAARDGLGGGVGTCVWAELGTGVLIEDGTSEREFR